jgi:hypothetical protein
MLKSTIHKALITASSFLQRQWLPTASAGRNATICSSSSTLATCDAASTGGLFGIARLQTPTDFPHWAEDAIAR